MKKVETVNRLHNKAMVLAQAALLARVTGNLAKVKQLSQQAFEYERKAAMLLFSDYDIEPTRSVLFRSAASLALNGENYRAASEMIAYGLNPYHEIAYELIGLIDDLKTHAEVPKLLEVANNLSNQAICYDERGEYADAKPLYELALAIREKLLGSKEVVDSGVSG
jgi:tetratricopeptide (TPR) repeat protein